MVSIEQRFSQGIQNAIGFGSLAAVIGALNGFIYAKFADLPAGPAAKAWAVYFAAEAALQTFVTILTESMSGKLLATIVVTSITTAIGIQELRKRGVLGDKMMIFMVASQVLYSLCSCLSLTVAIALEDGT